MRNLKKIVAISMCLITGIVSVMPNSIIEKAYAAEQKAIRGDAAVSDTPQVPYESYIPSASPAPSESPDPSVTDTPSESPAPSESPSDNFVVPDSKHLFYDYTYETAVANTAVVIYGNGMNKIVDGKKVNNKQFVAYTDITASYNYTVNSKGVVKPAAGKVVVGITKSNQKPQVTKNKITDSEAAKIAKAKIKNGQVTVTATGKEKGVVYLWVIDTGSLAVYDSCPINVQLAPKKLEIQNGTGSKLKNPQVTSGSAVSVHVAGIVNDKKTNDCTYKATVDTKSQSYITVQPVDGKKDEFTVTAKGLNNDKKTKATVVFECNENGKKVKFSLTITK